MVYSNPKFFSSKNASVFFGKCREIKFAVGEKILWFQFTLNFSFAYTEKHLSAHFAYLSHPYLRAWRASCNGGCRQNGHFVRCGFSNHCHATWALRAFFVVQAKQAPRERYRWFLRHRVFPARPRSLGFQPLPSSSPCHRGRHRILKAKASK